MALASVFAFIDKHDIWHYDELVDICMSGCGSGLFGTVTGNSVPVIVAYIESRRVCLEKGEA